jgi:hypothetical protein
MALVSHQRPLKRQAEDAGVASLGELYACGHIMVIAAVIATASSSVGTGEIVDRLMLIV